jgi:hypothetical protein
VHERREDRLRDPQAVFAGPPLLWYTSRAVETSRDVILLVTQTMLGAIVLMLGLATILRGLRARTLSVAWRLLALVPPIAPIVAWRGGARALPIAWGLSIFAYFLIANVSGGPS